MSESGNVVKDQNLDGAYERLHRTGPEWGGNMANHGPMAVEVMARHDRTDEIPGWIDAYTPRLMEAPAASEPITDATWQTALGDRVGDWCVYLTRQVRERPWRDVLATWWPRLLPGITAGATHGTIRTGHAVRTLLAVDESEGESKSGESDAALDELAHGLAYWAARFRGVPGVATPAGTLGAARALDAVPRIDQQDGPIRIRLGMLGELPGWPESVTALRPAIEPDQVRDRLTEVIDAATLRYLTHGHASPTLLVHTATAPNAILHTLPALPREQWAPSMTVAWAASAAITSMYGPAAALPRNDLPTAPRGNDPAAEVLDRAFAHGDEHVIKFTDTAIEVYARTGDPDALAAAVHATALFERQ
jgi:hypothetical protein